jgi:hypothetical protein
LSVEECGSGSVAAKAVVLCGQKNRKAPKKCKNDPSLIRVSSS